MFNYILLFGIFGLAALSVTKSPSINLLTGIPIVLGGLLATARILAFEFKKRDEKHTKAVFAKKGSVLLLNDLNKKNVGAQVFFPPLLHKYPPKDLAEKLFQTYLGSYTNDHIDIVFRVISVLSKTLLPWNLQTVSSAILNPATFSRYMNHMFDESDQLFFEALRDGILPLNKNFLSELDQISDKLWFLYSDIRLGISVDGHFVIPSSNWQTADEKFINFFIEATIIQPAELLSYLDRSVLTPQIPNTVIFR